MSSPRKIELLAPAANAEIAKEAILHGADAVYIGPPSHGARKNAANSIQDISKLVDFAHQFGVKIYATVNTIVYENELKQVEKLVRDLYIAGVDALIIQDMGLLRLDLPPISLHASTQCDTRTVEKALFLEKVGFSQIVLARELTLKEITNICVSVNVPIETFIHGALCVSYSGRCHASQSVCGRSANRGECAQICRLPFTLTDSTGRILAKDKHLLSLKDFNASDRLRELLEAGVSSFKIEGRLKDVGYVKNVVAAYRKKLDTIMDHSDGKYIRSSYGTSIVSFNPQLDKSFNRGFTHYFLDNRSAKGITSPKTPKSMGEKIDDISALHKGDGISFFNQKGEYEGVMVNGIEQNKIIGNRPFLIPRGSSIYRTFDIQWQKTLARPTAVRKLWFDVEISSSHISAYDEIGNKICISIESDIQKAIKPMDVRAQFDKFGNTIYSLRNLKLDFDYNIFIPASHLADIRKRILKALGEVSKATYAYEYRRTEDMNFPYPSRDLDYQDNVANSKAYTFYITHQVDSIEAAMETKETIPGSSKTKKSRSVMTTRHCILRENGRCLKTTPADKRDFKLPLKLRSGKDTFLLDFDCRRCEMHVIHSGN